MPTSDKQPKVKVCEKKVPLAVPRIWRLCSNELSECSESRLSYRGEQQFMVFVMEECFVVGYLVRKDEVPGLRQRPSKTEGPPTYHAVYVAALDVSSAGNFLSEGLDEGFLSDYTSAENIRFAL